MRRRRAPAAGARRACSTRARPLHGRRAVLRARPPDDRRPARRAATCASATWCCVRPVPARRGAARAEVVRSLGRPDVARDVLEALLVDRGHDARLPARGRGARRGDGRAARGRRAAAARPHRAADVHDRPGRARRTSTTRSRPSATATALRLYVHIADVAAFVRPGLGARRARRSGAATASTCPGAVEPMLPQALSSDACSLVPGRAAQRGHGRDARSAPDGTVAQRVLLPQPDPLRRPPHLRGRSTASSPAREPAPERGRRAARAARARSPAQLRERAAGARRARGRDAPSRSSSSTTTGNVVAARRRRPDRGALGDRAADDPRQRAGRAASSSGARRRPSYRVHEQPDPAAVERLVAQLESLDVPTPPLPEHITPRDGRASSWARSAPRVLEYLRAHRAAAARALTSLVLRSLKQAYLLAAQHRARRPRERQPTATSPRRSAAIPTWSSTARCWRRSARTRSRRRRTSSRRSRAHCTATEREAMRARARRRRHLPRLPARARCSPSDGWEQEFEGEVTRRDRRRARS